VPAVKKQLLESVPLQSQKVQWREFGPDAILVDTRSGDYAQINQTGVLIWKEIDGRRSVREIADSLASQFDSNPDELAEDVGGFVEELVEKQLLSIRA
jgi:hypothetical protein